MDTSADDIDHRGYAWMWEVCPWTDKQIQLFSSLPLEIVRLVFEIAIFDKPWPLHLLLVCQLTPQWLEPIVHLQVDLENEDRIWRFHRTISQQHALPTKNLTLFWPHVRKIQEFFVGTEEIITVARFLPGLHCLVCWDRDSRRTLTDMLLDLTITWNDEDLFPYKHLQRMTILIKRSISFAHRTFRNITHLDIYFEPTLDWESLQSMRNLTHLSIDMVTDVPGCIETTELPYWFRRILDACSPGVKIVIFGIVDDSNADFDLVDSEGNYFPPGWPPCNAEGWIDWLVSDTRCYNNTDFDTLHPIAWLSSGGVDPRAVAAVLTQNDPTLQGPPCPLSFAG